MKPRVPLTAHLTYACAVAGGVLALAVSGRTALDQLDPLAAGTFLGTALGMLLGRGRLRLWLVILIVANLLWFGLMLLSPFWFLRDNPSGTTVELALMAFAPAALCGYLATSERAALAAFWFPVALWLPALVDTSDGMAVVADEKGWLLGVLGVGFLGFLHARETRRVALWRRGGATLVADARPAEVLRRSPSRSLFQLGWAIGTGALTLALTAWVAPKLWQTETLGNLHPTPPLAEADPVAPSTAPSHAAPSAGWAPAGPTAHSTKLGRFVTGRKAPCCPAAASTFDQAHLREYFPFMPLHDEVADRTPAVACVSCVEGKAVHTATAMAQGGAVSGDVPSEPGLGTSPNPPVPERPQAEPPRPPSSYDPPAPPSSPWVDSDFGEDDDLGSTSTEEPLRSARLEGNARTTSPWLLLLLVPFLWGLTELVLRPVRRILTIRHLRRGLWSESVEQRVSNLWQLVLVGLGDAGFQAVRGEQPQELARRVRLPGIERCALVLERARHGVRVEPADLETMRERSSEAYGAARSKAGRVARALGLFRWPLV